MDDGGGLENRYAGDCIVGSNPTPSATLLSHIVPKCIICITFVLRWTRKTGQLVKWESCS